MGNKAKDGRPGSGGARHSATRKRGRPRTAASVCAEIDALAVAIAERGRARWTTDELSQVLVAVERLSQALEGWRE